MSKYRYFGNERFINAVESRLEDAGFERTQDEDASIAITFFTSLTALEDTYFGDDSLIESMPKKSIAIDLSSCTPNLASEICSVATISDLTMVSAPLCVKNKLSEDAFARSNCYCYAGSEDDGIEQVMTLLDALFGDVRPVADAGAAQLARTARTIQNTSEMVSVIEALALFEACGNSASSNIDVLTLAPHATSPEAYFVLEAVKEKRFKGEYTVEMLLSEISAAMMTADDFEMILPQTEAAFHLYELLAIIGGADLSPAALIKVYEGDRPTAEDDAKELGLDWSRAENLYSSDEGHDHHDDGIDEHLDYLDDDYPENYGFSYN